MRESLAALIVLILGAVVAAQTIDGGLATWHPITITFDGPHAAEMDNAPNPFLDIRLQVAFEGPENQRFVAPGFFDGDGQGGSKGQVWRANGATRRRFGKGRQWRLICRRRRATQSHCRI
jgi:hypothetical protein